MRLFGSFMFLFLAASLAGAPATQPSGIEYRAIQAFNRGEYAIALPLLQKLADDAGNAPDKLGPLREQIQVCQKNLKDASQATPATQPADGPPAAEARKPHVKPKDGQTLDIAIKDLGNFEYDDEKGGNVPDDVKALSGCKIRLHGFMAAPDQADNITTFALVPSLFACCYGQPPQLQHTVIVACPKGKGVQYYPEEIVIEGTLKVDEKRDGGFIISIFEVNASSVKPAPK